MSGNTTTSNNFTGLYGASAGTVVPTTPYGNANVVSLLAVGTDGANTVGNIVAAGNVTANYFLGNGSQLTGIASSYGNANVTALLANFGANTISTTGNITGGNLRTGGIVSATGNISTAGFFLGTFAGNISGNLTVPGANTQVLFNNQGNAGASAGFTFDSASNVMSVTGNAVGGNIITAGVVSAAGNITGAFILGNGSQLTGLPATYGNANVVANLAALGSNPVSTTGNVTAGYFIGNGSLLTAIPAGNITGQVANALVAGTVYTPAQPNITSVGTLTSVSVSGNITGANLAITTDAVIQGNLTVNGNTTFINSNTVTINDKFINVANNAATAAAANGGGLGVGPVGAEYATLTYNSTANAWNTSIAISATGNVGGNFFIGNGSQLTGVVATSVGVLPSLSVTGNIDTGNLRTAGLVSATGNVTGGNILTTAVQATGSGGVTLKNSAGVTQASYGAGGGDNFAINVSTNLNGNNAQIDISPTGTGHVHIKPTGTGAIEIAPTSTGSINNMIIGNATPAAINATTASASGNITGGNILTVGAVSATGNVSGNFFIGNGSLLTGISGGGTYGNANVSNFLANGFGSNTIVTTGNVSTGNIIVANDKTIYASGGTFGPPNGTFAPVRVGLYGSDASFAIGVESGYSWIQGTDGVKLYNNSAVTLTANAAGITGANILTGGVVSATGNITGGNLLTVGVVSATGNIAGNFFIGNGSLLTGISAGTNYSNANVAAFLPVYGANIISSTGNITGGNLNTTGKVIADGDISGQNLSLTGGITAIGSQLRIGTISATGNISTTGNVIAANFYGDGSGITGVVANTAQTVTANAQANITSVGTLTSLSVSGNITGANIRTAGSITATGNLTAGNVDTGKITSGVISAQGNITAAGGFYFLGDGSLLTGIVGTYANANVANFLANFGSNTVSTTGNITSGNFNTSGLVSATGNVRGGNILTVGQISATGNITGGNVDTARVNANTVTVNTTISAVGNITGGNLLGTGVFVTTATASGNVIGGNLTTTGVITATGNIQGGNINVPGGTITSFTMSTTGTITGGNLQTPGSICATGNIQGGNVDTGRVNTSNVTSSGPISAVGNITTASYFIGDGSLITNLPLGGYGNANVANFLANYGSNVISGTGNITGSNIRASGFVSAAGNIAATGWVFGNAGGSFNNPVFSTAFSASGNITGNYFIGNGSALTGVSASAGGANTQIQFNNASAFGGNANLTFNNTTGNVNLGNLIFTTSNATNFLNTVTPSAGTPAANATAFNSSQIIIGNGWAGNLNLNNQTGAVAQRGSKLLYWDTIPITDSGGPRVNGIGSNPYIQLQGNVSNTNSRLAALASTLVIGGTANNFQYTTNSQFAATGTSTGVSVGQPSTAIAIGNTTVTNMVGVVSNMSVNGASNVGNSSGIYSALTPASTAYLQTGAGLVIHFAGNPSVASDNVFGVYMNGNTSQNIFGGITNTNGMRKAANYYFLRNDDNLAQNKLGSLRLFNEFQYDGANTTGTLAVDKNNGQVQNVYLTGNITSVTFSNFVTSASDGTTTDYQTDTVTLVLRQGATPYTVTMPSGTAYKYAAGANTVGTTANTVTMVSITGTYDSVSAADQYLITISPEFS